MNADRIASQTFHNQIKKLSNTLEEQKKKTIKAQREAKDQKQANFAELAQLCIKSIPTTAPSDSITQT